ncbi:MAG: Uma2 family endonuclease [Actinomycetota bacterium]|nr:Uma2 family endonuclease [Actinomycetota bacterium]
MPTLILGTPPHEIKELMERRRRAGLDRFDEVWEGVYHMVPAPSHAHGDLESQLHAILRPVARRAGLKMTGQVNVGESEDDFRVPDGALHQPGAGGIWHSTAALVLEILSPGDESWKKLPFYARHDVDEVLIVDPDERTVTWLALREGEYRAVQRSGLLEYGAAELAEQIDWP